MSNKFDFMNGKISVKECKKENLPHCQNKLNNSYLTDEFVCNKPASVCYSDIDGTKLYLCDACDGMINKDGLMEFKKLDKQEAMKSDSIERWQAFEGFVFDRDRKASVALISNNNKQSPFPQDVAQKIAELLNAKWTNTTFDKKNFGVVFQKSKW